MTDETILSRTQGEQFSNTFRDFCVVTLRVRRMNQISTVPETGDDLYCIIYVNSIVIQAGPRFQNKRKIAK